MYSHGESPCFGSWQSLTDRRADSCPRKMKNVVSADYGLSDAAVHSVGLVILGFLHKIYDRLQRIQLLTIIKLSMVLSFNERYIARWQNGAHSKTTVRLPDCSSSICGSNVHRSCPTSLPNAWAYASNSYQSG